MTANTNFLNEFQKFEGFLRSFALKLTRESESAKDLFQETALKALKYQHHYNENTNIKGWLVTIMKNTFINDYRRKKRQNIIFDYSNNDYLFDTTQTFLKNDGESKMITEEINNLIEKLDDKHKIPFMLKVHGYKYEEIAEKLALPLGTIKSRIFIAKKRLQKGYRKYN